MTKNKYIALLLAGIFLFPILSQPVHFLRHHQDDIPQCCTEIACHDAPLPDNDLPLFVQGIKHCPICEYKFSINTSHSQAIFECSLPKTIEIWIEANYPLIIITPLTAKTPRAPPVMLA